jgi:hypothetical protein
MSKITTKTFTRKRILNNESIKTNQFFKALVYYQNLSQITNFTNILKSGSCEATKLDGNLAKQLNATFFTPVQCVFISGLTTFSLLFFKNSQT